MFLPSLIDYVQTQFEVPKDLPMVYTCTIPENENEEGNGYSILELDSPLSRNSDATRMEVEVVGIYTDKDTENGMNLPSMAMVVVKKMNLGDTGDVMMKRMFDDSESKIVKALERGLDDFIDGRLKVGGAGSRNVVEVDTGEWSAFDTLDDYEGFDQQDGIMEDLMVAATGRSVSNVEDIAKLAKVAKVSKVSKVSKDNIIIDAVVSDVKPEKKSKSGDKKAGEKKSKKAQTDEQPVQVVEDFAVTAAKAAAAKRKKTEEKSNSSATGTGGDFAVESAKAAAKARAGNKKESAKKKTSKSAGAGTEIQQEVSMGQAMPMELPTTGESPMLKNLSKSGARSFQVKISSPNTFKKRNKVFDNAVAENVNSAKVAKKQRAINVVTDTSVDASSMSEEERQQSMENLTFQQIPTSQSNESNPKGRVTKTDEEIEQDIIKAALDFMPGSDDSEGDISAEEMLKNILKFGEEKEKEETEGSGFVKGAFSKAMELTERNKKVGVQFKEVSKIPDLLENIKYEEEGSNEPLSAEEELKRIFAAGESIAEGRMTKSIAAKNTGSDSIVTDQYVDELIEADKTVPGNARTLDDELAELEIRISKSPGEDTEAYGPNALFDVFSGPEVYNPNVDPLTSVNWPGAQSGTRTDLRLPPELSEAVKSSKFAARLLSRMVEEEEDEETKVFYIDGKKVSDEQVQRLQRAVDEGVAVGLIQDPIQYMKERSRLQMLVSELVRQPEERFGEIATFYKDLLLSDNFVTLLKESLRSMASSHLEMQRSGEDSTKLEDEHAMEREILGKLVKYSQLLLKEAQALGAELENAQLEVIRSICNVAMDPNHKTEEETAEALTGAVRDMKPLLDENFVAYLKYAIAEEESRLARAGLLDDPEHNRWLFVLQIVQEGVYAELAVGVQRYIDHISYVLRMDTKKERRQLLSKLIDVMPSLVRFIIILSYILCFEVSNSALPTQDIRPFIKVVDNIAASLGQGTKGEFDTAVLGGMTNKILQLRRDVHELLPPERIKAMSKEADEWAARQRERLMEQRGISQQRLKSARETESYDEEIGRRGEVERFD